MPDRRSFESRGISKLVEKQMRNWELARAQRLDVPKDDRPEVEDFVTISRQVGAGGLQFGTALAERLKWPLFDKEILQVMAGDDSVRRRIYESMDERDLTWREATLRSVLQPEIVKDDYFRRLTYTVLSLARQGRAVFLGRGADCILPQQIGLRVRLVAPFDTRAQRMADRQGLTLEQAREEVARIEQERADFIRHHFGVDMDDPTRFDLAINLGRISTAQAVELVVGECKRRGMEV